MWGAKELSHLSAQACAVFLGHRTPRVVLACGAALALYRLSEAALGWEDVLGAFAASHAAVALQHGLLPRALASPPARARAAVAGGAACLWLAQEWAIHARLLHSARPWFGAGPAARRPPRGAPLSLPCAPHRAGSGRAGEADSPAGATQRLDGRTCAAAPGQTLNPYTRYPNLRRRAGPARGAPQRALLPRLHRRRGAGGAGDGARGAGVRRGVRRRAGARPHRDARLLGGRPGLPVDALLRAPAHRAALALRAGRAPAPHAVRPPLARLRRLDRFGWRLGRTPTGGLLPRAWRRLRVCPPWRPVCAPWLGVPMARAYSLCRAARASEHPPRAPRAEQGAWRWCRPRQLHAAPQERGCTCALRLRAPRGGAWGRAGTTAARRSTGCPSACRRWTPCLARCRRRRRRCPSRRSPRGRRTACARRLGWHLKRGVKCGSSALAATLCRWEAAFGAPRHWRRPRLFWRLPRG